MPVASCHCGDVEIRVAKLPPDVTDCNCSICHRYGVLWAYFAPPRVTITAKRPTATYVRDGGTQAFHRCATCGCVTHWAKFDPDADKLGVNARLFAPEVLATARIRHLDGAVTDEYIDD